MGEAESPRVDGACGGNVMKTRRRDDSRIPGRSLEQTPSLLLGVRVQPHRHSSWQELSSSGPCQLPADALPLRRPGASDAPSQQGPDVWSLSLSLSCRIEEELGDEARFAGHNFRNPSVL